VKLHQWKNLCLNSFYCICPCFVTYNARSIFWQSPLLKSRWNWCIINNIIFFESPDPDYENAENILDRLGLQDHGSGTPTPLVNINCECLIHHSLTKKQENLYSSKHFSDSDSDDEGWYKFVLVLVQFYYVYGSF
jgi:hypothetical protein